MQSRDNQTTKSRHEELISAVEKVGVPEAVRRIESVATEIPAPPARAIEGGQNRGATVGAGTQMTDSDCMERALRQILDWCEAYPIEVFPEPDLGAIRKKVGDSQMSRLHASWARHLLAGIAGYARGGLCANAE